MARPSAAALATRPVNVVHTRISPPPHLEPEVSRIFRSVVAAVDAQHFTSADVTLLVEYSRACAQADRATREMAIGGAIVAGKPSPWLALQEKSWRAMGMFSIR